jgi:hypothetical protein
LSQHIWQTCCQIPQSKMQALHMVEGLQMERLIVLKLCPWFFQYSLCLGLYPNFEKWRKGLLLLATINTVSKYTGNICRPFLSLQELCDQATLHVWSESHSKFKTYSSNIVIPRSLERDDFGWNGLHVYSSNCSLHH